jgi:hypothetical protein
VRGKPKDPAYWRNWRAAHPEYRERERLRAKKRGDRTAEYARRNAKRASRAIPEIPPLYPHLQRGKALSFWEDELRLDLAQERALAVLEGRDPDAAARAYAARETNWQGHSGVLLERDQRDE